MADTKECPPMFVLKSEELVSLFRARATHHEQRAAYYEEQARKAPPAPPMGLQFQAQMTGYHDPGAQIRASWQSHQHDAKRYAFLAEHVAPQQTFILTDRQLSGLGIFET